MIDDSLLMDDVEWDDVESQYSTLEEIHGSLNYTLDEFRAAYESLAVLEKAIHDRPSIVNPGRRIDGSKW